MDEKEKKITTTIEDVQKAVEKKADEKSEAKTVSVIEEFTKTMGTFQETMREVVEAVKARPEPKQIDVPDLIKQMSPQNVIIVKDVKYPLGLIALAVANATFNISENNSKSQTPFSDELSRMGIDEKMILCENSIKTMNASVFTQGGVFIPEVWDNMIIPMLTAKAVVMAAGANVIDMPSGNLNITSILTGAEYYSVGEQIAITDSIPTFGSVTLNKHLGGVRIPVSNELLKSGRVNTAQVIQKLIIEKMTLGKDNRLLLGTGSSYQPLGLNSQISSTNAVAMTGGGSPTAATRKTDLRKLKSNLTAAKVGMNNCAWFMNPLVKDNLEGQVDSNSNPMDYAKEMIEKKTLLSFPIFTTTEIPFIATCNVYLIDMDYVIVGQSEQPTVQFIQDGDYYVSGTLTSGRITRTSVFEAIEGYDIVLTQALAGGKITGVTWGA